MCVFNYFFKYFTKRYPMNNDAVAVPWFGQIVVYVHIKMAADGDGQLWFNNGI